MAETANNSMEKDKELGLTKCSVKTVVDCNVCDECSGMCSVNIFASKLLDVLFNLLYKFMNFVGPQIFLIIFVFVNLLADIRIIGT